MARKFFIIISILSLLLISACAKDENKNSEKDSIEKFTEKVADDALHAIQDPINKAKDVENIVNDRQKMLDQNLGEE